MCARETQVMAPLHHQHVARFYGVSVDADAYCLLIVLELLEGGNLTRRLEHQAAASTQDRLQVARQILDALVYLHDHKVIHRDLNPNNVLFDGKDRVCVADFGLARPVLSTHLTLTSGGGAGTPNYMPPEQFTKSSLTYAADVYAFGAVLYALFMGTPPYAKMDYLEIAKATCAAECLAVPDSVPKPVRLVIEACTRRDPQQRITASEARDWVDQALSAESVGSATEVRSRTGFRL